MKKKISRKRHLAKAISYRIIGSTITGIAGWALTGSLGVGGLICGIDFFAKIVIYYLHERIWYNCIKFGVESGPPPIPDVKGKGFWDDPKNVIRITEDNDFIDLRNVNKNTHYSCRCGNAWDRDGYEICSERCSRCGRMVYSPHNTERG